MPPLSDLRVVAHNLHAGAGNQGNKKAKHAASLIAEHDADLGVFTEAKTVVKPLRATGLRVYGENPELREGKYLPEQGDTIIASVKKVRDWRIHPCDFVWLVRSHDQWHDPRRDVSVTRRGPVKAVRGCHLPPGGPNSAVNGRAWCDQMDDILEWLYRRGCRAAVGDFNASAKVIADYARRRGYRGLVIDGVGVDLCLVVHGTVTAKNLGRQGDGYDHPAVRFDITADRDELRRLRRIWRRNKQK